MDVQKYADAPSHIVLMAESVSVEVANDPRLVWVELVPACWMTHLPGTNAPQVVEHALVCVVEGLAAEHAESATVAPFATQDTVLVWA
jgi:hypothetical protein